MKKGPFPNTSGERTLLAEGILTIANVQNLLRHDSHRNNPNIKYNLAVCYYRANEIRAALDVLKSFPPGQRVSEDYFLIGQCFQKLNQKEDALFFFKQVKDWRSNNKVLTEVIVCHVDIHQHQTAQSYARQLKDLSSNGKVIRALLKSYTLQGNLNGVNAIYQEFKGGEDRSGVDFRYAQCLHKLGRYQDALPIFARLYVAKPEYITAFACAQTYYLLKQYARVDALLTDKPWSNQSECLILRAKSFNQLGQHEKARDLLAPIEAKDEKLKLVLSESLMALGKQHRRKGDFVKADDIFSQALVALNNLKTPSASLQRAKIFVANGECEQALSLLKRCWQEHAALAVLNAKILKKWKFEEFENFLGEALKRFPDSDELQVLHVFHLRYQGKMENAIRFAKERFDKTHSTKLALMLLAMFSELGCARELEHFFNFIRPYYQSHPRFMEMADTLLRYQLFNCLAIEPLKLVKTPLQKVTLPKHIMAELTRLEFYGVQAYLAGSTLTDLLSEEESFKTHIDYIILNPEVLEAAPNDHLIPSRRTLGLYRYVGQEVAFMSEEPFFPHATGPVLQKLWDEFTINILVCDASGYVLDPTQQGVSDLKSKTLRTVCDPRESLDRDGTRVLRAVKYLSRGYQCAPDLEQALRDWQPNPQDSVLLWYTLGEHLSLLSEERFMDYVQTLHDLGLADKLVTLFVQQNLQIAECLYWCDEYLQANKPIVTSFEQAQRKSDEEYFQSMQKRLEYLSFDTLDSKLFNNPLKP